MFLITKILKVLTVTGMLLMSIHTPLIAADKPAFTLVNPVRGPQLGLENVNLLENLKGQWQVTKEADAKGTWLWQFSALENTELINLAKNEMQNQEHGIFLEIDKNTAEKSGVDYKGKIAWYQSDGLLLVSYDQFEREKLIDTMFKKFKDTFGYYPKSVGAWWVGAESIQYMQKKYGITAVLQCADQYNTDAYAIWGTPWSIPYIPAKNNAAIPAKNDADSAKVVMMQWAPRDPLRGYGPTLEESTYSVQDYERKGYKIGYFEYLKDIFAKKGGDQVIIGLEAGLPAEVYKNQYKEQIVTAKNLEKENKFIMQTMQDYAKDFLKRGKALPPTNAFLTKDYESNNQSYIYNSPYLRFILKKVENEVYIVDLRDYKNTETEDFYTLPNTQTLLRIYTKAPIDSATFPEQKIKVTTAPEPLTVQAENNTQILKAGNKKIAEVTDTTVKVWKDNNNPLIYDFAPKWWDPFFDFFKNKNGKTKDRVITTPFEEEALEFIKKQNKEVVFVLPDTEPTYRAVRPVLLADEKFGKNKTGKNWTNLKSTQETDESALKNKLIVVPAYLGSSVHALGTQSADLKKIFDNFQIQIYSQ